MLGEHEAKRMIEKIIAPRRCACMSDGHSVTITIYSPENNELELTVGGIQSVKLSSPQGVVQLASELQADLNALSVLKNRD